MSKRTEDLALQARNRAAAEQRQNQTKQGNSDAAESPDALRREQERKALARSQQQVPSDPFRGFDPEQRAAEERVRREQAEAQAQREGGPAAEGQSTEAQVLNGTVLDTPAPLHSEANPSTVSPPTASPDQPAKAG